MEPEKVQFWILVVACVLLAVFFVATEWKNGVLEKSVSDLNASNKLLQGSITGYQTTLKMDLNSYCYLTVTDGNWGFSARTPFCEKLAVDCLSVAQDFGWNCSYTISKLDENVGGFELRRCICRN